MSQSRDKAGTPWHREEVAAAVEDYLQMLRLEIHGETFNKSERRRGLKRWLDGRSDSAIERKHQNISAVLRELGLPSIDGYKPLGNYQTRLAEVIVERLSESDELLALLEQRVTEPAEVPEVDDLLQRWTSPPPLLPRNTQGREVNPPERARKVNYIEREIRNATLGWAGELFVLRFEQARLVFAGKDHLASDVEQVSVTRGDHLGFDILSFEPDGRERLIEVKTTGFGRYTPFFVTQNEVEVSQRDFDVYHLYRVFDFRCEPRLFALSGAIGSSVRLEPTAYRAELRVPD